MNRSENKLKAPHAQIIFLLGLLVHGFLGLYYLCFSHRLIETAFDSFVITFDGLLYIILIPYALVLATMNLWNRNFVFAICPCVFVFFVIFILVLGFDQSTIFTTQFIPRLVIQLVLIIISWVFARKTELTFFIKDEHNEQV